MSFHAIVRESLRDCRSNPVLFVPPLVAFITTLLYYSQTSLAIPSRGLSGGSLADLFANVPVAVFGFLYLAALFMVILGQAAMTGKVVSDGKTRLADWGLGARRYFFTVLAISLFLGIIRSQLYLLTNSLALGLGSPANFFSFQAFLVVWLPSDLLFVIAYAFFYLWLASAILDSKGVGASFVLAVKALRRNWTIFAGFILLFFAVSGIRVTISYLRVPPVVGSFTMTGIISEIIKRASSPLWFLLAFIMYRRTSVSQPVVIVDSVKGGSLRSQASAAMKAGGIVGLTVSIAFAALFFAMIWNDLPTEFARIAGTTNKAIYALLGFFVLLAIFFAIGGFLGAIAALIFVKLVNKIHVRSIYVKAVGFGFCLWLALSLIISRSILSYYPQVFLYGLVLFVVEAVIFAYLFNRWTRRDRHQPPFALK